MKQINRTSKRITGLVYLVGALTLEQSETYCLNARHKEEVYYPPQISQNPLDPIELYNKQDKEFGEVFMALFFYSYIKLAIRAIRNCGDYDENK